METSLASYKDRGRMVDELNENLRLMAQKKPDIR